MKNYSLITRDEIVTLSPGYDFLNSAIVTGSEEETALPIMGRKRKLDRTMFIEYLARDRMDLSSNIIDGIIESLHMIKPQFHHWIKRSFLSKGMKEGYIKLLDKRFERMGF